MKKILIDPGHGGHDPGAIGPSGTKEKDIALKVADALEYYLSRNGFLCFFTRNQDIFVSLKNRVAMAHKYKVDLFLSVHCNGFHKPSAKGFEVYTSIGKTESDKIATSIYNEVDKANITTMRPDFSDGDPDKEANFYVLRATRMAAVLVELDFITNPEKEELLNSFAYQDKLAQLIALGIINYYA